MGTSESDGCLRFTERLPIAKPVEARAELPKMAPVRAVSPEIAAILPPVGILREAASGPPRIPQPMVPQAAESGRKGEGLPAPGGSFVMTLAVIATAMGVGALATIAALDRDHDGHERSSAATVDTPRVKAVESDNNEHATLTMQAPAAGSIHSSLDSPDFVGLEAAATPAVERPLDQVLAEIEGRLRDRDIAGATTRMQEVAGQPWSEAQVARIEQTSALVSTVRSFWEGFEAALEEAPAGRSVRWGGQEAVIVEVNQSALIVRRAGMNLRVSRHELTAEDVAALAESLLDPRDARNSLSLGAFFYVTHGADSREARRLWESAAALGADVSLLLPLLAKQ
jgi:hypothetical protein